MTGLGDTTCTDDELDMLALCPSTGGVPDYTACVCNAPDATAPTVTTDVSSYWPWLLAGAALLYFGLGKR
jgi:hypothetical protein